MHFLKKLLKTPILKDPAREHMDVHRHFYKYSKGDFIGPALKISLTSAKITLKGTHEYEDLVAEIVANSIEVPDQKFVITGKLISGQDISDLIKKLGFNWSLIKSKGKTQNYKADIQQEITKPKLLEAIEEFRSNSYFLVSFNLGANCKVTTKKNIPQPSKKKIEEDDVNKRVQFSTGYLKNTSDNLSRLLELALPDFVEELPNKWKSIILYNNYKITDIELPANVKDSRLLRILAIRKGKLTRIANVDGAPLEKQYSFVA
ncbi:MAG: hypothetical protein ACTSUX_04805 [Promethearchaeota archaeon]